MLKSASSNKVSLDGNNLTHLQSRRYDPESQREQSLIGEDQNLKSYS